MRIGMLTIFMVMTSQSVLAHGTHDVAQAKFVPVALESNRVSITEKGHYRIIQSNGIPKHQTGQFPNSGNPHTITPQDYSFTVTLRPEKTGHSNLSNRTMFGVTLNGVPFDPGTAEFYNNDRRSGWNIEAITGNRNLGLDSNNAHVQPDGSYHYHGIPWGVVGGGPHDGNLMMIGYAADGFPIYMPADKGRGLKSSYRVKNGTRLSGPGGAYDGTYTQDWEYVAGLGDLDDCNGTNINGAYAYVLTAQFPFIPRCFKGTPHESFEKASPGRQQQGGADRRRPPPHMRPGHRPPPPF